jgi:hypothetical protein
MNRPFNDSNAQGNSGVYVILSQVTLIMRLMKTIPALSPLRSSRQPNASIIFRGEPFPIFKEVFMTYSMKAAAPDDANQSNFVITSAVTRESVQIFVDLCQEKSSTFDDSQILDLL